jgi:hypothetical protein
VRGTQAKSAGHGRALGSATGATARVLRVSALLALILAVIFSPALSVHAQQAKPSEYKVKAAYLYNFGRFVNWPEKVTPEQDGVFAVCVFGPDPFGPVLDSTLAGVSLDGKPVVTKRITKPQDATACRILFINSTEESHLREILAAVDQAGVLTVSDMPDFSRRGGMIQFILEGERIRFEVNLANAANSGLTLSSELLKVAASVRGNPHSGD